MGRNDFEGIGPDEKYWGVMKLREMGGITLNLQGAPLSKLTSWTYSMRFKKAANGNNPEQGNIAAFGILCQPIADTPSTIAYASSICIIYCGRDNSFALSNGTAEAFKNLIIYTPPSASSYTPYVTETGKPSQDSVTASNSSSSGVLSSIKNSLLGSATKSVSGITSKAAGVTTGIAGGVAGAASGIASGVVSGAAGAASGLVGGLLSKVSFVTGAISSLVKSDKLAALNTSVKNLNTAATGAINSAAANIKSSLANVQPGSITPAMGKVTVPSPEVGAEAEKVKAAEADIPPTVPEVAESATSGPFFEVLLTYVNGRVYASVDGYVFGDLDVPESVLTNLATKPYVIGTVTSAVRIQVDKLSFSAT